MKRVFSKILVAVTLVVFVILLSCCIGYSCLIRKFDKKIFANSIEFEWLVDFEKESITDDMDLTDFEILWSYGKTIEYEGYEYKVFAYEFSSGVYAKRYYIYWANETSISNLDDWDFALSTTTYSDGWVYVIYSNNKLYRIVGESSKVVGEEGNILQFINFFTKEFTVNLK